MKRFWHISKDELTNFPDGRKKRSTIAHLAQSERGQICREERCIIRPSLCPPSERLCFAPRSLFLSAPLLPDAFVSAPRYARISSQTRPHLPPDAFAHGTVFAIRHRGSIGRHRKALLMRPFPPSSLRLARTVYCQRFSECLRLNGWAGFRVAEC